MKHLLADREGFLWPIIDRETWPCVRMELAEVPHLLDLCKTKRTCIQAGGNGGLWPHALAPHFDRLWTFEPDPVLFRCLVTNTPFEHVRAFPAALGGRGGEFCTLDRWVPTNPGANRVDFGWGNVPVMAIDDFMLTDVDLIQLDIEGAELHALRGAEGTIDQCKPVISVELRGHSGRFGNSDQDVRDWLGRRGYKRAARMNHDEFYTHG